MSEKLWGGEPFWAWAGPRSVALDALPGAVWLLRLLPFDANRGGIWTHDLRVMSREGRPDQLRDGVVKPTCVARDHVSPVPVSGNRGHLGG